MSFKQVHFGFRLMQTQFPGQHSILVWILVLTQWITIPLLPNPTKASDHRLLEGNPSDVNPTLMGPVFNLGGGGRDVDAAIQWMINQVRGCRTCMTTVDVVVVRSPDSDPSDDAAYNQPIARMDGVDSVETLVIGSRAAANDAAIARRVRDAEVVFFAGGDQCSYARNVQRTALETAIQSVYVRGGGIGGTSAGAMIQSEFVYDACLQGRTNVTSRAALRDPYGNISFTPDLFPWAIFKGTVIDTHFDVDDRLGRLMSFVSRQIRDGVAEQAMGIGLPEATSLVVNQQGLAQVMGRGPVVVVLADHPPEVCEPLRSLTYSNFKIWQIRRGQTFNLKDRPTNGYILKSVDRGQIQDSD